MDAIKKKIQYMKRDKDAAMDRVEVAEISVRQAKVRVEKTQDEVDFITKRIAQIGQEFEVTKGTLMTAIERLEAKEKKLQAAESEMTTLSRKLQGIETKFEKTEDNLKQTELKHEAAAQLADDSHRMCNVLESRAITDAERIKALDAMLKNVTSMAEEADRKEGEVSNRLAFLEIDCEMAEDRVHTGELKILELEEELKVVGDNLKSLEVSEEKAKLMEVQHKKNIAILTAKLKEVEARAYFSEFTVTKLLKEVDRVDGELQNEKSKCRGIVDELDGTFTEIAGY